SADRRYLLQAIGLVGRALLRRAHPGHSRHNPRCPDGYREPTRGTAVPSSKPCQGRRRSVHMIRVGIGGWVFEPWRGEFYPKGLPHARELEHARRHLTTTATNPPLYPPHQPPHLP